MVSDEGATAPRGGRGPRARGRAPIYAALDLGTNNCRLLMAVPELGGGLKVVDGFSRIVRLGEGLAQTGKLGEAAMARAYQALQACAQRIEARRPVAVGCVATQACRAAANGQTFLNRIKQDFGLDFQVISPQQEALLSVLGCASLMDRQSDIAMVVDIGGGSTEISWVRPSDVIGNGVNPPVLGWSSTPLGVVTLAEDEAEPEHDRPAWYEARVARLADQLRTIDVHEDVGAAFGAGRAQMIGTSGTVTSLAGVHLNLLRYERQKVDGMCFQVSDCRAAIARLLALDHAGRAAHPCIGKDRADLVIAGGTILDAVLRVWPADSIRVADRGLREGVLMRLMAEHGAR